MIEAYFSHAKGASQSPLTEIEISHWKHRCVACFPKCMKLYMSEDSIYFLFSLVAISEMKLKPKCVIHLWLIYVLYTYLKATSQN